MGHSTDSLNLELATHDADPECLLPLQQHLFLVEPRSYPKDKDDLQLDAYFWVQCRGNTEKPTFEEIDPTLGAEARACWELLVSRTKIWDQIEVEKEIKAKNIKQFEAAVKVMMEKQVSIFKKKGYDDPTKVGLFKTRIENLDVWLQDKVANACTKLDGLQKDLQSLNERLDAKFDSLVSRAFKLRQEAAFAPSAELLRELEGLCIDDEIPDSKLEPGTAPDQNVEGNAAVDPTLPKDSGASDSAAVMETAPQGSASESKEEEKTLDESKKAEQGEGDSATKGNEEEKSAGQSTNDGNVPLELPGSGEKKNEMKEDGPELSSSSELKDGQKEDKSKDSNSTEPGDKADQPTLMGGPSDKADKVTPIKTEPMEEGQPLVSKLPHEQALSHVQQLEDGPLKSALMNLCESMMIKDTYTCECIKPINQTLKMYIAVVFDWRNCAGRQGCSGRSWGCCISNVAEKGHFQT